MLVQVRHIPRAENSRADALAKLSTASQEDLNKQTPVEHLAEPSIDLYDEEVSPIMSEPSWMDPMGLFNRRTGYPMTQKRPLSLGRGRPGLLFIKETCISEVF